MVILIAKDLWDMTKEVEGIVRCMVEVSKEVEGIVGCKVEVYEQKILSSKRLLKFELVGKVLQF